MYLLNLVYLSAVARILSELGTNDRAYMCIQAIADMSRVLQLNPNHVNAAFARYIYI